MDPKKKFILFKQSKHFCSVPWNHFKINMDGSVTTCVNGKYILGNITEESIEDILAKPKLKEIKENLYQDILDDNCSTCRTYENSQDYIFLRNLYNPLFKSGDVDYTKSDSFTLQGVDLHWSSLCNLKCITCWSNQSSSIALEEGKEILHTPTEHADCLIDYIVANQETLQEIYLSGGEPTLIKHNLRLLKRLRRDLPFQIRINSNMTYDMDNQIVKELLEFPNVIFTISADSMRERFNYIRRGADWHKFLINLDNLSGTHFKWRLNSVFFVGSALYLAETQNFFRDNYGITDFTINQCQMGHPELECKNLPSEVKVQVIANLSEHQQKYKHDHNLFGQLTNCLTELNSPGNPDYQQYFESVDKKAGTSWTKTFPELVYV